MKILMMILMFCAVSFEANAIIEDLKISTSKLNKGSGFEGANVLLTGKKKDDTNILMVVSGPNRSFVVWKREELYGLWRNSKKFTIPAIFSFLQITFSGDWRNNRSMILNRVNLDLDYKDFTPIEQESESDIYQFQNFIAGYYKQNNFLNIQNAKIDLLGNNEFRAVIKVLRNAPIGSYNVKVYELDRIGNVVNQDVSSFEVVQTTTDYKIKKLFEDSPILYATVAVGFALLMGSLIGYLFNGFRKQEIDA